MVWLWSLWRGVRWRRVVRRGFVRESLGWGRRRSCILEGSSGV
jgi:hypothetical protein